MRFLCKVGIHDWSPVQHTNSKEWFPIIFWSYITEYGKRTCYRCHQEQKMYRSGIAGAEEVPPKWRKS